MLDFSSTDPAELLADFQRNDTAGIHWELAHYLQGKIESGVLQPREKLPSLRELAKLWEINVFSVKLATDALVNNGLLNKRQGKGMFVSAQNGEVHRVGIYMSKAPDSFSISDLSFAFALRDLLYARLQEQGIEFILYDDYRPGEEHSSPPLNLQDAIISRRLQSVIGLIVRSYDQGWFNRLPIRKISDNTVQGAIQAILESGISVPQGLFVLFHHNVELGYYCNFAADDIDVSIADIAGKLIQRISDRGEKF